MMAWSFYDQNGVLQIGLPTPLPAAQGGTGQNTSTWNGIPTVNAGTWTINNVLTANRLLIAAAGNTITSNANCIFDGTTFTLGRPIYMPTDSGGLLPGGPGIESRGTFLMIAGGSDSVRFFNSLVTVERMRLTDAGLLALGGTVPVGLFSILGDRAQPFTVQKSTVAVVAPGSGQFLLRAEAGTNAGTLKFVGYAGTSTTGVTIVDNVGAGN